MSAIFADAAARLAGAAGAVAGWSPEQFWRATPAELAAVFAAMVPEDGGCASSSDLMRLMEMFPDG